jgi:hypothetical protein
MLFDIVNPSDPYTIVAPDLEIAAIACVFLGNGQYAFKQIDCGAVAAEVPMFLFGGHDEWFTEKFGAKLDDVLDRVMVKRRDELAACFDSAFIGGPVDRKEFESLTNHLTREQFRAARNARHENRRTSLNDIGARAYEMAKRLRELPDEGTPT